MFRIIRGQTGANPGFYPSGVLARGADGSLYGTTRGGGADNGGTIFKVTPAGVLTSLIDFTAANRATQGRVPWGGLTLGSDGNFYGVTALGGASDCGTIFRMTPAGMLTTLVHFTGTAGNALGSTPTGDLLPATDGAFYGMTGGGGAGNYGTIFRMTAGGTFTTLVSFTGTGGSNPGSGPSGGLIEKRAGEFFGTTSSGGAADAGTVFGVDTAGHRYTLLALAGTGNSGAAPAGSLVLGADGSLYGMTREGGASDLGTLFRITANGVRTTVFEFTGGDGAAPGNVRRAGELMRGRDGNLYGVSADGGSVYQDGSVFRITMPSSVFTYTEGEGRAQTGTYSAAGTVQISASSGIVTQNDAAGTWTWSGVWPDGPLTQTVTITAIDGQGVTGSTSFTQVSINAAPFLVVNAPNTADEDAGVPYTFTASDPATGYGGRLCVDAGLRRRHGGDPARRDGFAAGADARFHRPRNLHRKGDGDGKDGGARTTSQPITIVDVTPPVVPPHADVTVEATSAAGAVVNYAPATGTDNLPASPAIAYSQASGTVFPLGTTTVTTSTE